MTEAVPRLGIGMVGYAFMGVAHSQAWRNAPRFFDLPLRLDMAAVAGRDEAAVTAAATKLGWSPGPPGWWFRRRPEVVRTRSGLERGVDVLVDVL